MLRVLLPALFVYVGGSASCFGDVPLVIPATSNTKADALMSFLYLYGQRTGLQPGETISCPQLLTHAPLMCNSQGMQVYCCASCASVGLRSCTDQHFTIGMINSTHESGWSYNPNGYGNSRWSGIWPEYIAELALVMGFNYTYLPVGQLNVISGDLVASGAVDMTITELRGSYFHRYTDAVPTTSSVVQFLYSIAIRKCNHAADSGMWRIFTPFTNELWLLVFAGIMACGFVLWVVESRLFATAVGDEVATWLVRLVRTGTLFFVLVVFGTYTAELASILASETRIADGPTTLDAAVETKICCLSGKDEPSCVSDNWIEPPSGVPGPEAAAYCMNALRKGFVDGVLADDFMISSLLGDDCEGLMHSGISYSPSDLALVLSPRISHLLKSFNAAIAKVKSDNLYSEIERRYFPEPCIYEGYATDTGVSVRHMSGLFVILACFCCVVLLAFSTPTVLTRLGWWRGCAVDDETSEDFDDTITSDVRLSVRSKSRGMMTVLHNQKKKMKVLRKLQKRERVT